MPPKPPKKKKDRKKPVAIARDHVQMNVNMCASDDERQNEGKSSAEVTLQRRSNKPSVPKNGSTPNPGSGSQKKPRARDEPEPETSKSGGATHPPPTKKQKPVEPEKPDNAYLVILDTNCRSFIKHTIFSGLKFWNDNHAQYSTATNTLCGLFMKTHNIRYWETNEWWTYAVARMKKTLSEHRNNTTKKLEKTYYGKFGYTILS